MTVEEVEDQPGYGSTNITPNITRNMFGNGPMLTMYQGQTVRWYVRQARPASERPDQRGAQ